MEPLQVELARALHEECRLSAKELCDLRWCEFIGERHFEVFHMGKRRRASAETKALLDRCPIRCGFVFYCPTDKKVRQVKVTEMAEALGDDRLVRRTRRAEAVRMLVRNLLPQAS